GGSGPRNGYAGGAPGGGRRPPCSVPSTVVTPDKAHLSEPRIPGSGVGSPLVFPRAWVTVGDRWADCLRALVFPPRPGGAVTRREGLACCRFPDYLVRPP